MSGVQMQKAMQYQTVAASQTNAKLGATGAAGDYLDKLIITVSTASTGTVTVTDGQTSTLSKDLLYLPAFNGNNIGNSVAQPINVGVDFYLYGDYSNWPTSGVLKIYDITFKRTQYIAYSNLYYDGTDYTHIIITQVGLYGCPAFTLTLVQPNGIDFYLFDITGYTAQLTSITNLPQQGIVGITTGGVTEYINYVAAANNQLTIAPNGRGEKGSAIAAHVPTDVTSFGNSTFTLTAANTPIGVYTVPMTTQCVSNAWRITTGAGASVVAIGQFT